MTSSAPPPLRRQLRNHMLALVGSVVALDAVMIGLYYGFHIGDASVKLQQEFVAVWVVLTLVVILPPLKRIRQARRGRLREP